MHFVKITAIVLILSAGVAGSYVIVKNSLPKIELTEKKENISKSVDSIVKNPIQWIKNAISSDAADDAYGGNSSLNKELADKDLSSLNLTEFVAKSFFSQMKILDQQGKSPFENFDPNDAENRKFIENAIANIQNPSQIFNVLINDNDLKISEDNSVEAKSEYLTETARIILKNSNDFYKNPQKAFNNFTNNFDISGIEQIINAHSKILDGFLNIETPSDYLDIHKRYVALLKKTKEIYLGLADYNNDPVKAGLSIQLLPEIAEAELNIKNEYYQETLNLNQ